MRRCLSAHDPPSFKPPLTGSQRKPWPVRSQGSPISDSMAGEASGTAQLMSHHMSNFAHTSDDECLSLVACLAFECAAFDASCIQRFNQSDRSLPAACGA
jgi:hypothetical protein